MLDYPHPLVTLKADGTMDYSQVYDAGIGAVGQGDDRVRLPGLPPGTDEQKVLDAIIEEGHKKDLYYLTNQDLGAAPARRPVVERHEHRGGAGANDGSAAGRDVALRRTVHQA